MALPVRRLILMMPLIAAVLGFVPADERPGPVMRTESFDRDPGWEAHNNRIVPAKYPTIVQDFGYSTTNFAGRAAGEMGGQVWRASEPAFYAAQDRPQDARRPADRLRDVRDHPDDTGRRRLLRLLPGRAAGSGGPPDRLARPAPGQRAQPAVGWPCD